MQEPPPNLAVFNLGGQEGHLLESPITFHIVLVSFPRDKPEMMISVQLGSEDGPKKH